jgi:DNA-binding beta-propeller fold protein YncE
LRRAQRVLGTAILAASAMPACSSVGSLTFVAAPTPPETLAPCAAPIPVSPLDEAEFAPVVGGELVLVRAEGDARLSAEGGIVVAWSEDSATVTFSDRGAVTTWRVSDGKLLDLVRCTDSELGANDVALSPDGNTVTVSGILRDGYDGSRDTHTNCIVDRKTKSARLVSDPTAVEPSSRGGGSSVSRDGRRVVTWDTCTAVALDGSERKGSPAPVAGDTNFLQVSEVQSGRVLWRTRNVGCGYTWQFSPDDRFLEKTWGRYSREIVDALTGERVRFPGGLTQISPDGKRVITLTPTGPELWSVGPAARLVGGGRHRTVMARSRDGAVAASVDEQNRLVIEREDGCSPLPLGLGSDEVVAFSPNGSELYVSGRGNVISHSVFRTDTGALSKALYAEGGFASYPMPATGQVAFGVEGGIRVYDAHSGAPVSVARAPRTRYQQFAEYERRPARDHGGDRPDRLSSFVTATADGRYLVGATSLTYPSVTIWDLQDPRAVVDFFVPDRITAIAFSPDERFVAAGDAKGALLLWERGGRSVSLSARPTSPPLKLAFSPRGDRLAAAFTDGTVEVIDTSTGRTQGTIALPSQRASFLWWSPDNQRLVIDTTRHLRFELRRR